MSSWADLLKVIQLKPRFLFGMWILGALILFMPIGIAETLGIGDIRESIRPYLGLGTLAAFSFWLVQLIPHYRTLRARQRYRANLLRTLDSISPEAWTLLAYCLEMNQQTITLEITDRTANALRAQGILRRAGGAASILAWPYTIHADVWEHLLRNRKEFMQNSPFTLPEVECRFRNLHHHITRNDF